MVPGARHKERRAQFGCCFWFVRRPVGPSVARLVPCDGGLDLLGHPRLVPGVLADRHVLLPLYLIIFGLCTAWKANLLSCISESMLDMNDNN